MQYRRKKAGTTAKACLDFVRCLRVVLARRRTWDPFIALSHQVLDGRTVARLAAQAAIDRDTRPTLREFLQRQQFIRGPKLLEQLDDALR